MNEQERNLCSPLALSSRAAGPEIQTPFANLGAPLAGSGCSLETISPALATCRHSYNSILPPNSIQRALDMSIRQQHKQGFTDRQSWGWGRGKVGVGACETKGLRGAASPLLEPGVTPGTAKLTVLSHQAGRQGRGCRSSTHWGL